MLVQTVEMTDRWRGKPLSLAGAGTLVQISFLAFMFVWERYQQGELPAHGLASAHHESPLHRHVFSDTQDNPIPSDPRLSASI